MAADLEPGGPELEAPPPVVAAPVRVGPRGELVWRSLREVWLANRALSRGHTHFKGGYAWNAPKYLPVFMIDAEGAPLLAFRKR